MRACSKFRAVNSELTGLFRALVLPVVMVTDACNQEKEDICFPTAADLLFANADHKYFK